MKAKIFTFVRGLKNGTPPRFQSYLKSLILLLVMMMSVNMWGAKITTLAGITSGKNYYIGATYNSTDYYFKAADISKTGSTAGTGTTTKSEAVVVTITKSGDNYTMKVGDNLWLSLSSSKSNGNVTIENSAANWTFTEASSLIHMVKGSYCLTFNYNGGSTKFGSYGSKQTSDVWLEAAAAAEPHTVTLSDDTSNPLTETSAGAGVELPTRTTTCTDYTFAGWSETNCTSETTTAPTIIEAGEYKPTKNIDLYPVFTRTVAGGGEPQVDVIDNAATATGTSGKGTSAWATDFDVTKNATYTIHTMGLNSGMALRWNTNGFLETKTPAGANIQNVTASGTSGKSIKIFAKNVGDADYTSIATLNLSGENNDISYDFKATENYTHIKIIGGSSATDIKKITITYGAASTTYYITTPQCDPSAPSIAASAVAFGTTFAVTGSEQITVTGANLSNAIVASIKEENTIYSTEGTLTAGGGTLTIKYDATGKEAGPYNATLVLTSGETSVEYAITLTLKTYTTCAQANSLAKDATATLGAFDVVYVNGNYIYIKDNTGSTLLYIKDYGLVAGDHVAAGMEVKGNPYNQLPEAIPTTAFSALEVTHNAFTPTPEALSAAPTAADVNKYVKLENVKANETEYFTTSSSSDETTVEFYSTDVTVRNGFKQALSFASGTYYDMIGTVARYNSTIQIYPISIEEKEATKYAITFTEPIENGSASVDADDNKAVAGATITITTNPADGYKDGTITVVANDETPIEVTNKQFEMPAQSVTITVTFVAKEQYTITWNDRGNTDTQTNVIEGEGLALPENPTAPIGWEFVGWTAIEGYSHETDAPAFAKNGDAVTMATTYYAVYAMVDGDAATGWKLSTGAPVADEQVILAAKGGEDYYAMYANTVDGAATATKLILNDDGIVTNTDRLYWDVVAASYNTFEGLGIRNGLTKTVSSEEQPVYLHLNSSVTKLTTGFQNGVFEFAQSGEGYTFYSKVNSRYLTFAYTADPETASYSVAENGGCVLYVFRYTSTQYFKYTTAPAPQVTIHFELGAGEGPIDDVMINKGSDYVVTSSEPTPATGYDFVGWLYNELTYVAGQTISNVQTDITLTAQYEAKTYAINYDLAEGTWDGAEGVDTYTYGVGVILPTNVKKDGNNFAGWYAQGAEEPTTEIGATETGAKSFTAHWIPATSRTITYVGADENIEFSTKPMSVDGEATELTIEYSIVNHYSLNAVTVMVGETPLTDEVDYTWDQEMIYIMTEGFDDNVTITFDIQPIVFTVQWLVNGTPVKEIENVLEGTAYGTLTAPEDPADDTFDNCDANKFMGWATEALEEAGDADDFEIIKVDDSYVIKEGQTKLYAVFATEGEGAVKVGDVLWAEDFSGFSANDVPTESNDNTVVYGDASLTYTTEKSGTKIYDAKLAGGESPEILIAESGGSFGCSNIPTAGVAKMNFTFYSNKNSGISVSSSTTGITVGTLTYTGTSAPYIYSCEINNPNKLTTFQLQINKSQSSNSREDNISLTVAEAPVEITNFITNCDMSTYRVKFDANAPAGETVTGVLPAVADVDPTEDYIVPAATLTADRYTQIGWNEVNTATTAQTTVEKMDAGENTTLYAIWQAKDFEISVKTAPTKVEYKTNATFDPTGLVITKNYTGGFTEVVEYAGNESDFTFEPSLSTPLTTAITEVTITYAGKTCTQAITVEEAVLPTYYWVANATELQAGDKIILVCGDKNAIAGPLGTGKFLTKVDLEEGAISNGKVTVENAFEITLGGESGAWTLTSTEGTIGATAAKNLSVTSGTTTWTISFNEDGNALITSTTSSYGTIKYNSTDPRFLNYASGQNDIQIYAKRDTRKTLRENLSDGKMYSFCPAYRLAYVEGAIFYQPDYMDAAYVHFVEAEEIKAGYGYILEGLGDDLKAFEVGEALTEAVDADAENTRGMQGVLKGNANYDINGENEGYQFPATSYSQALVSNNHLQYVGKDNVIIVGRAYLDLSIIAGLTAKDEIQYPGLRRVAINFGGQAPTNLDGINGNMKAAKVLRDGQLYIIRDAKMYNAQGTLLNDELNRFAE